MMYPEYSNAKTCGGSYSLNGKVCTWEVTREGEHYTARIHGDYRHEGKSYIYRKRIDALEALPGMIFAEVA